MFINKFKNEGLKYTTTSLGNFFRNNFTHLGTMTNILDRGKKGVFSKLFYDNINDMDEKHLKGIRRVENRLNDIAQSATGKDWTKWKYSLGTDILELDNIIETREGTVMEKFPINMDQALRIYALSLNNIQNNKLVEQGITRENLNKIKSFIGKDNLEVVDQVVDFLSNEYFEEVNSIFSQANDVNLGYINNYFPTKTISQAAINKEMLQSDDFSGIFTAEYAPALKERTDRKSDILLGFSFTEAMEEHVQQIEKYKAYALGVKEMNEVLKHQPTQNVLKETGMMQVFKKSLNYAINPDSGPALSNDVVSKVQRLFTGFALAFKPIQIIKQATSFIQAYDTYNSGINVKGKQVLGLDLLSFVADYAYVLGNIVNEIKESREISAGFDSRIKAGLKGEIFGLESGGRTFKSTKARQDTVGKLARGFKRAAGLPTVVGDILGVLGYKAVYNADIRNGMSKDKALRKFNDYNATQQSKRATEKVGIQQSTNEFTRAFTMFGSTVLLQQNKIIQSMNSILTDIGNKKVPKAKDIKTLALNYSIANVLFTAAAYSMNFINGNDEDKDRAWKAIKDAALGKTLIYQIPFLGAALEEWENWASDSRRPTSDVVNPLSSVSRKIRRSIESSQKSGELIKTIQPLAEILIGAQVDAPLALAKLLGTGDVSEENIYDLLGVSRSYRPGYGNKKNNNTSRKKTSKKNIRLIDPDLYEELYGGESIKSEINKEIRDELKE